jgi:hypothetical protein
MPYTLLTEIQEFCERMMLPVPQSIIGNDDPQIIQLKSLLYEAGQSIAIRGEWSRLTFEATHTTLAQENQGNIYTITSGVAIATAFRKIKDQTVWDRTDQMYISPIDPISWQSTKALAAISPRYRYRLLRGELLLTPTPPAGHTLAFEWVSKWWIQDGNTGAIKERFVADTDSFLLERELLKLSLRWRWKREKGLDYGEEYDECEDRIQEMLAHDTPKEVLYQDETHWGIRPGIFVPAYSWNVT